MCLSLLSTVDYQHFADDVHGSTVYCDGQRKKSLSSYYPTQATVMSSSMSLDPLHLVDVMQGMTWNMLSDSFMESVLLYPT